MHLATGLRKIFRFSKTAILFFDWKFQCWQFWSVLTHFSQREMVLWLFQRFSDELQTLPSSSPERQLKEEIIMVLTLRFRINQHLVQMCVGFWCVVGHSCHGACPTGSMSCGLTDYAMSVHWEVFITCVITTTRMWQKVRYLTQQPSITELKPIHFCKNVLLNNSPCSVAHQLSNTNDISMIYIWVPKTVQEFFILFCNPKKISPQFQLADS